MIGRISRLRPSSAGVVATVALVLAVGMGGAYAANKISSKQINTSAVKSKHIKDGGVRSNDLAADVQVASARSATTAKTADTAKTAESAKRAETATTVAPTGVNSAAIADGTVGTTDLANESVESVQLKNGNVRGADLGPVSLRSASIEVPANTTSSRLTVQCQPGEVMLGGGGVWDSPQSNGKYLLGSYPTGSVWAVYARNSTTEAAVLRAHALCLHA